jgi:hypothetical protein
MRSELKTRLGRLERATLPCMHTYELKVVYYGEPEPPQADSWGLTVVLHHDWCTEPGHSGLCVRPETLTHAKETRCEQDC